MPEHSVSLVSKVPDVFISKSGAFRAMARRLSSSAPFCCPPGQDISRWSVQQGNWTSYTMVQASGSRWKVPVLLKASRGLSGHHFYRALLVKTMTGQSRLQGRSNRLSPGQDECQGTCTHLDSPTAAYSQRTDGHHGTRAHLCVCVKW